MVIFGEKYDFTEFEIQRLRGRFNAILHVDEMGELRRTISHTNVSLIVLNLDDAVSGSIVRYLSDLSVEYGIEFLTFEHFMEKYLFKCYIPKGCTQLHWLDDLKPYTKWQYFQKRCIDFFGVFWLFFFSWPVMLTCKKKIKEQSLGPVFYKQMRVGYANREFECIKFRSMRLDAEKDGARFASKDDDRIFPWGKVMRRTRFDELPQMLNILKGEMHLIGPRPERLVYTRQFCAEIPYYNERHLVAPGITGWAQVMYPYGESAEDARQKLMYDLYYIKHWSIWREFQIVYLTAKTVINKKGV